MSGGKTSGNGTELRQLPDC